TGSDLRISHAGALCHRIWGVHSHIISLFVILKPVARVPLHRAILNTTAFDCLSEPRVSFRVEFILWGGVPINWGGLPVPWEVLPVPRRVFPILWGSKLILWGSKLILWRSALHCHIHRFLLLVGSIRVISFPLLLT